MSALGRHRDSILNLQAYRENSARNLANCSNSDELAKKNDDVVVSDGDDEMFGVIIDEEDEFVSADENEEKSNAIVSDDDDAMFGLFIDEDDAKPTVQLDSGDKVMKSDGVVASDDDDEMFGFFVDEDDPKQSDQVDAGDKLMKFDDGDEMFGEDNEFSTTPLHKTQAPKKGILKQVIEVKSSKGRRGRSGSLDCRLSAGSLTALSLEKKVRFSDDEDQVHEVMPLEPYKCDVWWDHDDYGEFRKTATFLAHSVPDEEALSWMNGSHKLEPPSELSTPDINSNVNSVCEKWWCKFGHSRRGLEHLCCEKEGTKRRTKVEELMKAVLYEQYKQALKRRRGKGYDHSAIARVSMKHTQWAKDLSLAAGYADASAVATDFDEEVKKNREDYMHIARTNSDNGKIMGRSLSSLALNKMKKITSMVSLSSKG